MASSMYLPLIILVVISLQQTPTFATKKTYIVSHQHGPNPTQQDVKNAEQSQYELMKSAGEWNHPSKGFSDAGLKLASRFIAEKKNFVFSPASINVGLSLLSAGSTGKTQDEFLTFFNSKNIHELNECVNKIMNDLLADVPSFEQQPRVSDSLPKLSVANAVWIDKSMKIKTKFHRVAKTIYKADVKTVDFRTKSMEVVGEVNSWVQGKTNGLIKHLLTPDSIDSDTRLILTNAVYFKASWVTHFKPSSTIHHRFRLLSGKHVHTPFMTNRESQYVSQFDGFKVLGLRYKNARFSMYIFLPDANDGLSALAEKLISSGSAFVDDHIPRSQVKLGEFLIPRFKMTYDFEASEVLQQLGLVSPFRRSNGLTEIADEELIVSKVIHKAFIQVNEQGTEAAAATAISVSNGCALNFKTPELMDFVADHPFLFVIREDVTGLLLFVGQVINPDDEE